MSEEQTGVESVSAAGGQEELDLDNYFSDEDTGDNDPAAAGQGTGDEGEVGTGEEGSAGDERTEQAFAKRLAAEREKIRHEMEEEYQSKNVQQQNTPPPVTPAQPPPLPKEQLDKLSYELGLSEEAVQVLYHQQHQLNLQNELVRNQASYIASLEDNSTKSQAKAEIEKQRAANPMLPEFDEQKVSQIRSDYRAKHGKAMPWKDAYKQLVAEEAISGNLLRSVEQKTVQQVAKRGTKTVQAVKGGGASSRPGIEDLSLDDFNKLVEKAKAGKFKKS